MEYHNPTLRVIRILEQIDANPAGTSLTELSGNLDLPKGTISPILKTLAATGYILWKNSRYTIGPRAFELGLGFAGENDAISLIRRQMRDIVAEVGELCQMGVLSNLDVLYILKETPNTPISVISEVGRKVPAHVTGLGKALLSGKADGELRALYADYPLTAYTKNSITDLDVLLRQIREARRTGVAYECEESKADVECVAVPLVLDGAVKAAISVTVPKFRYDAEKRRQIAEVLLQKKKLIETVSCVQNYHLEI
jgi:IclR family KDG regulon transcriptional repressor